MRVRPSRVLLLLIVFALALGPLFACGEDPHYSFDDGPNDRLETETGANLTLGARLAYPKTRGCACKSSDEGYNYESVTDVDYSVEPADGATVSSDGVFTATRPGTYTVMVSGTYGSATTTVVVEGEPLPEEEGPPVEDADEPDETDEPDISPLVGTWEFAPYHASQPAGVTTWQWITDDSRLRFTIAQAPDGTLSIAGAIPGTTMSASGDSVSIEQPMGDASNMIRLEGTVSGNTITGTQSYDYANIGTFSTEWVATKI